MTQCYSISTLKALIFFNFLFLCFYFIFCRFLQIMPCSHGSETLASRILEDNFCGLGLGLGLEVLALALALASRVTALALALASRALALVLALALRVLALALALALGFWP
jgi:hypothetical protein